MSDVAIFVSYSHVDESSTYGRVKALAADVGHSFAGLTGRDVGTIFVDTNSIKLGEDWRDRLRSGLGDATILLAFVSPSYLRSVACRSEMTEFLSFLATGGGSRLIIPLLLVGQQRMDDLFPDDELWKKIIGLQSLLIEQLKFEDKGSSDWMKAVEKIAIRVEEKLDEQAKRGDAVAPDLLPTAEEDSPDPVGIYDLIARAEVGIPEIAGITQEYSAVIAHYNAPVVTATPLMTNSSSFNDRLEISRNLAEALTPIVEEAERLSRLLDQRVREVDPAVIASIRFVKAAPDGDSAGSQLFLTTIRDYAKSALTSTDAAIASAEAIAGNKGYSADLDKRLSMMQDALLRTADARAIYGSWINEIGDLAEE
ncbi:MAG TPA: toll/interleukin-1 receptor domain-containing protein [Pseudonocardiaceae bacterium]|nr:toll/interleukin-1 receptor domain-containing protein [Pseudonocardiaceae bacterium]